MNREELLRTPLLLSGEDPQTTDVGQARHWWGVYNRLVGFAEQLSVERETDPLSIDEDLQREADRLRRRRDYWYRRVRHLVGRASIASHRVHRPRPTDRF